MKDNIIISWPAHCFLENILPLLSNLNKKYNVYYLTENYDVPKVVLERLNNLKNNKYLSDFYVLPKYSNLFSLYLSLQKLTKLKNLNFKLWITMSEISLYEKFIRDIILNDKCKKIILWTQITYLFENTILTERLISNNNSIENNFKTKKIIKPQSIKKIFKKNIFQITSIIIKIMAGKYRRMRKEIKVYYLKLISNLLFKYYFNKKLKYGKYDYLTQLGSGSCDYILFTDKKEVKAHKRLFGKNNVELVEHTGRNICKCINKSKKENKVLVPLSHPNNVDKIPDVELQIYLNALNITKEQTGINLYHLRPHPRENGNWPNYLCEFLNNHGIEAKVVTADYPIHEIICGYFGVIGESSCVLRDSANTCKFCFVIGIEKLSFHRYENPKFVFGEGQNINWIDKYGNYSKSFFNIKENTYYDNIKTIYDFL